MSSAPPLHPRQARFHELDILRGVAAIVVVIFHYKHFLLISEAQGFDYAHMPLSAVLMPLYLYGQFFVELFFAISGYVFFWLYAQSIHDRRTSAWGFFVARFARLYPLYLLTLLIVAALQWAFRSRFGADFIYHGDTLGNFALNLLMVQQWVPYAAQSYNGPSWSISVEVFLYALFFAVCVFRLNRLRLNRPWVLAVLCAGGIVIRLMSHPTVDFVRGVPSFFEGGLIFYAVQWLRRHDLWRRRVSLALAGVIPCLWVICYLRGFHVPSALIEEGLWSVLFGVPAFLYVVLPLNLLALGLMQGHWPGVDHHSLDRWSWVGDTSYSIYLIHFPLQLLVMLALGHMPFAERAQIFASPLALLGFMAAAVGLAWLSFHYFEMPLRRILQKRLRPTKI